jgi:hypothetical protein
VTREEGFGRGIEWDGMGWVDPARMKLKLFEDDTEEAVVGKFSEGQLIGARRSRRCHHTADRE